MHKHIWLLVVLGGVLLLGAALVSCAPDTSAPEVQGRAEGAQLDVEDEAPAEQADTDTGEAVAMTEFTDQACLDCHSDEESVKTLAVEEEDTEELSSGPG